MKPRVLLIDLRGLSRPGETLDDVRFVMPPERVIVLMALGDRDRKRRPAFRVQRD